MITLPFKARVQADGTLSVTVPTGLAESEVNGVIVLEAASSPSAKNWPSGFFELTFGAFAAEPLERPPQGTLEVRETLR